MVELGLGLLSIGRPWGVRQEPPPTGDAALELLHKAVGLGIRFFDTAPAYGASKMGEFWDAGASSVDHRYDTLRRSIDRSLELLGRIDLLQVHKATADNLRSPDITRAIEYARSCGIHSFGASVPDVEAANAAAASGWCSYLQFPFSLANTALAPIFNRGMKLIINRPLAMGALSATPLEAFNFIRRQDFSGIVLTGTKSIAHLSENHAAFYPSR